MPRKRTVRSVKNACDILWSKAVRLRDKQCQRCLYLRALGYTDKVKPAEEAHHIYGRRNLTTRFELDNGLGLCTYCHKFDSQGFEQCGSSAINIQVIHRKIGEARWQELGYLSRSLVKWKLDDYLQIEDSLKRYIASLLNGNLKQ